MTKFELKVYKAVASIPFGEVRTYRWVAQKIRSPRAVRAVGQALKKNPYPLLIPCHRVVASGGAIGGFAWGVEKKKALLDLERQIRDSMV